MHVNGGVRFAAMRYPLSKPSASGRTAPPACGPACCPPSSLLWTSILTASPTFLHSFHAAALTFLRSFLTASLMFLRSFHIASPTFLSSFHTASPWVLHSSRTASPQRPHCNRRPPRPAINSSCLTANDGHVGRIPMARTSRSDAHQTAPLVIPYRTCTVPPVRFRRSRPMACPTIPLRLLEDLRLPTAPP